MALAMNERKCREFIIEERLNCIGYQIKMNTKHAMTYRASL
jgi:hypothetical protein